MNLAELDAELSKDPGYVQAGRELKPILDLADSVLAMRVMRNVSQQQLAHDAGHSIKWVEHVEAGFSNPRVSDLCDIATALDATLVVRLVPNEEGE